MDNKIFMFFFYIVRTKSQSKYGWCGLEVEGTNFAVKNVEDKENTSKR